MTTDGSPYMIKNKEMVTKEKKMMRKNRTGSMPPPVQLAKVQRNVNSDVPTPYEIRQMMEKRFENEDFSREISSETEEETDKLQTKLNDIEESIHQVERRLLFNPQLTIPFTKQAQIHYKKRSSTLTENSNSSQETSPKSRAKFFRKKAENLSNSQTTLESEVKKNLERKRALTAQLSSSSEDSGIGRRLSLDGENDGEQGNGEKQKKKKEKTKSLVKKFTTRARSRSLGFLFGEFLEL
ncbi:unnamed protein product, partial [Mesorhabditis belari]|uniref:Uncharacterized protein n=1 Tax=Mesorhabditis belari TaxID=2138241 RepID=A0AAF3F2P7_9BILA